MGVVFLFALFEIVIRWTHPEIPPLGTDAVLVQDSVYGSVPGLRRNASGRSNGALFRVDENGFLAYSGARSNRPAWLFLGDSVTMGIGVDPDDTFAGRLAESSPHQVLNPSIIGYDVRDYQTLLQHFLRNRPASGGIERVSVFWCLNDVYPFLQNAGAPGGGVRRAAGPILRFAQRHLRFYQWLKQLATDRPLAYFLHDLQFYRSSAVDSAASVLAEMHALARRHGMQFDVVLLPYQAQLRRDVEDATLPQDVMARALTRRGVPYLDLLPHLRSAPGRPSSLYAYGDGIHFSARGHELIATHLRHRLRSSESADS